METEVDKQKFKSWYLVAGVVYLGKRKDKNSKEADRDSDGLVCIWHNVVMAWTTSIELQEAFVDKEFLEVAHDHLAKSCIKPDEAIVLRTVVTNISYLGCMNEDTFLGKDHTTTSETRGLN